MVRMKTIEDFKSFIRSSNQQIVMLYGQRADHLEQCRSTVDLLRAAVKVFVFSIYFLNFLSLFI